MLIAAAVVLVLLHTPKGYEVYVNPESVTSMHADRPGATHEVFTDAVKCLLNLSDGKFVSVIETCDQVRALLEEAKQGVIPP
jgi:hypothetical protein